MTENSELQAFRTAFAQLKGDPSFTPYPWQERLFLEMSAGKIRSGLDIPTGLGKTSIIEIWLLAHLLGKTKPPMRLIYVVNRRTIVDQATDIANDLKESVKKLSAWKENHELAISPLRGALADNREWMRFPHHPAIIIGTVDMIGSRLLFDAYRAGKWTKSMHAGLLGQDSLVVHDEAHLSQPFQKLLEWIRDRQQSDGSPRPISVMAMSATGVSEDTNDRCKPLELDETDRAIESVRKRIHASKRLKIHACERSKLAETLSDLAARHEGEGASAKRIIVFVNTPELAKKVNASLNKKLKNIEGRIELLTGTIRGYERDCLIERPALQHLLESTRPPKTVYLISTSAGEVGADFDADHMICDIAPLDSMIQRLGRVNRRGDGDARIDVLVDIKEGGKIGDLDQRRLNTRTWLSKLPPFAADPEDRLNASSAALKTLRESHTPSYLAAISRPPTPVLPHDVTLDAWAMTSIQDDWSLAHQLDEYLHGAATYEPPMTAIAWRDEVSIFFPPSASADPTFYDRSERKQQFDTWLESCSLHPREIASNKSEDVMELLVHIGRKHPDAFFVRLDRRKICVERLGTYLEDFVNRDKAAQQRFCGQIANQTFILPCEVGGLNPAGMIDVDHLDKRVLDVADANADCPKERSRAWLSTDEDGDFSAPHWLGDLVQTDRLQYRSNWTQWRDEIKRDELKEGRKFRFGTKLKTFEKLWGVLLFFKKLPEERRENEEIKLEDHCKETETFACGFAKRLGEPVDAQVLHYAALWHDLGKNRVDWQASIGNLPGAQPLAKSFGKGMKSAELAGYRHEFGSLIDLIKETEFGNLDPDQKNLVLHLDAAHHGRSRPLFPQGDFDPDHRGQKNFNDLITPHAIAQRYASLQRKFGHWGLAWLESLLMCADQAASRGDEPEDVE